MLLFYFLCNQCHFAVGGALLFTLYKDGIKAKRPFKSLLYLTAIHEWVWIITYIQNVVLHLQLEWITDRQWP